MIRTLSGAAAFAGAAIAATAAAACPTNCSTCCNLPTTHQVVVPGVVVTPPAITVGPPTIGCNTCGENGGGGFGSINVTVNVEQTATAVANTSSSAGANAYSGAAANIILGGGGGGGSFFESGPSTSITNLTVVENTPPPPPPPTRKVCVAQKWVFAAVAVQAVCLDDKGSPHPASQTGPDRDVAPGFSGELFRCVAGSHMQYITVDYSGGPPSFDHGQTKVCNKGDALWRTAEGQLQCRPQTPARDCNERSLLRRYGPGIKVVKAGAQVCAAWSDQVVATAGPVPAPAPGQSFVGTGGVSGGGW